jgi:hypothetical protein
VSLLDDALALVRSGRTVIEIADALDLPTDLAGALVDHWVRLGVVGAAPRCTPGTIRGANRGVTCAGCPLSKGCPTATL